MSRRGVITVYLSLVTALMLSLILVSLESVRVAVIKTAALRSADLAAEMVFSAYTRPLADRYGIFVLNTGEGQERLSAFDDFLALNLLGDKAGGRTFAIQAEGGESTVTMTKNLRDQDWKALTEQIRRCELYALGEKGLASPAGFLQGLQTGPAESVSEQFAGSLQASGAASDAAEQAEREKEQEHSKDEEITKPTMTDPRPGIGRLLTGRILDTVMAGQPVSVKSISTADCSYEVSPDRPASHIGDFMHYRSAAHALQEQEPGSLSERLLQSAGEDLLLCTYILDHFLCLTGEASLPEGDHVLDYEAEYILCGGSQDRDNLENTMLRLFAFRTMFNLLYLYTSPSRGAALEEAVAMLALSSIPAVGSVIKLLLMLCWACAESLVDCTALAQGKKVPVRKTDDSWNLSLPQLVSLAVGESRPAGLIRDGSSGLTYRQYLFFLLLLEGREKKMVRMTQLMEKNIRLTEGYQEFSFRNCITGAVFGGEVSVKPRFWRHPQEIHCVYTAAYQY